MERHGGTGLIAVHAEELPGLNVFGRTLDEVRARLPRSIEALMRATCEQEVRVLGVEIDAAEDNGWADYEHMSGVVTYELLSAA